MPTPSLSPLCIYCGSSSGGSPAYRDAAHALGAAMGRHSIDLVYGGGRNGLMGDVADSVVRAGGHVLGIITQQLVDLETAHTGIPDLRIVDTMHERKMTMASAANGFVALAGGVGTLDELFEILAWAQLGLHAKPVGILNTRGYYDTLLSFLDHAQHEGFLRIKPRELIVVETDPDTLLARMQERVK